MPEEEIEAVIFDLDGTLIGTYEAMIRKLKRVFRSWEVEWLPEFTHKAFAYWGKPIKQFFDDVLEKEEPHIRNSMHIMYQRLDVRRPPRLIPGALETLAALEAKDVPFLLLTNRDGSTTRLYLRQLGLLDRFAHIGYGDKHQKPNIEIADETLSFLVLEKIRPSRVIIVGDSHDDRLLGKALGIRTVLVATSTLTRSNIEDHPQQDFIPSVADLPNLLWPRQLQAA